MNWSVISSEFTTNDKLDYLGLEDLLDAFKEKIDGITEPRISDDFEFISNESGGGAPLRFDRHFVPAVLLNSTFYPVKGPIPYMTSSTDLFDVRFATAVNMRVPWTNERPSENRELNAIIGAWFTFWRD
ncbi:hypothetical protein Tco_1419808 [Tanacetum coccineum]